MILNKYPSFKFAISEKIKNIIILVNKQIEKDSVNLKYKSLIIFIIFQYSIAKN